MSTDLYEVFDLPPPPPRTIFSTSRGSPARARFPNFLLEDDPADACRRFMHHLGQWKFGTAVTVQFIFIGCLQVLTLLILVTVVAIKVRQGRIWVVRMIHTKKGRMLSFNTTASFCFFMPINATLAIPSIVQHLRTYSWQLTDKFPGLFMWVIGPFLFPIIGISLTINGLAFALSGKGELGPVPVSKRSWITGMLDRPRLWNVFCVSTATVPIIPVVITGCISAHYITLGYDGLSEWNRKYATATLSRDMLVDGLTIWKQTLDGCFWACVALVLLTIDAAYIFILEVTVRTAVIGHVRETFGINSKTKDKQADTLSTAVMSGASNSTQTTANSGKTAASSTALAPNQSSYVLEVSQSDPEAIDHVRPHGQNSYIEVAADSPHDEGNLQPVNVASIKLTEPFPEQRQTESLAQRSAALQRSRKAILIHLWVQSITTLIGSVVLGALAAFASALIYDAHEHANLGTLEPILVLTSLWLISTFGLLLCLSTLYKDYDLGSLISKVIEFSDPTSGLGTYRSRRSQTTVSSARQRANSRFDRTVELDSMNTDDTKLATDAKQYSPLCPMSTA